MRNETLTLLASGAEHIIERVSEVILGKDRQIRLALACILARGHLLIEDLPGVGKTTLSQALARALGLEAQRIQFTSDLLPSDILGVSIFDRTTGAFRFQAGPIFHQLILADEINRATPKTQSALLEAMEEHQVTQDGETRALPEPFFVIATQNPTHQVGTYPLPESQLDRFMMRIDLGYPDRAAERDLLKGMDRREMLSSLKPSLTLPELSQLQAHAAEVHVSDPLVDYVQALIEHTRQPDRYATGLSPRGGLALLRAAKAWALIHGRGQVIPEDVQAVLDPVVSHRLRSSGEYGNSHASQRRISDILRAEVPIP